MAERVSPMDLGGDPRTALSAEGLSILREGIFLVLSCRWGLQMALYNYSKAVHKLGYDIVSWFTLSKGPFFGVKNVFLFFVIDWLCVVGIS